MSQEDSFEQESTDGISGQVDALQDVVGGDDDASAPDTPGPAEPDDAQPDADWGADSDADSGDGLAEAGERRSAWQAHGGGAPSRGPAVAGDGMSESASSGDEALTGPDGVEVDSDISDGGMSGQDSGSMS